MKEVVIGTSDAQDAVPVAPAPATLDADGAVRRPSIAEVELHVSRLRRLLMAADTREEAAKAADCAQQQQQQQHYCYSSSSSSNNNKANGAACTRVCIAADELERLETVCDMLDQVYYWAVEEATVQHAEEGEDEEVVLLPSLLAQAELPEVIYGCVCSDRPRVVTEALRIARVLLRHPQSAAELCRVAQRCHTSSEDEGEDKNHSDGRDTTREEAEEQSRRCAMGRTTRLVLPLLNTLRGVMARFPAAATLLTEAVCTVRALVEHTMHLHCVVVEAVVVEEGEGGLIAQVVHALQTHRDCPALQVAACTCLASIVAVAQDNRLRAASASEGVHDELEEKAGAAEEWGRVGFALTPVALLFAHSAALCQALFDALRSHAGQSEITRAVLDFVRTCAGAYRENGEALMRHGAYALVVHVWQSWTHSAEMFAMATETVACLVPFLDLYQQRTLLVLLRDLLVHRAEREVLMLGLALLHAVFRQLRHTAADGRTPGASAQHAGREYSSRDDSSVSKGRCGPFAMYQCYPQPPSPRRGERVTRRATESKTLVELRCSARLDHLVYADNVHFVYDACLPQLIGHVMDYYGAMAQTAPEADAVAAAGSLWRVAAEVLAALPAMSCPPVLY